MEIEKKEIEQMIRKILLENLGDGAFSGTGAGNPGNAVTPAGSVPEETDIMLRKKAEGLIRVQVPNIKTSERDRLDTGKAKDIVYTHDLFSLEESPRLGCGIMEMEQTTFDWSLDYDEIDYVIEGCLTVIKNGCRMTAGPGELILIPKGSKIQFSVPEKARFLYVTYPADWNA